MAGSGFRQGSIAVPHRSNATRWVVLVSLRRRAMLGFVWAYSGFIGQRLLSLLTTAVLARLLLPADFGLIAFALLVLGLIDALCDFGIKDALIYMSGPVETAAD